MTGESALDSIVQIAGSSPAMTGISEYYCKLIRYYRTFRTMTKIEHTEEALGDDYFCVNLKVKLRYINPLVAGKRLSEVSEKGRRIIEDFKTYSDTPYGCAKLV